ncbi:hypothetical protein [Peribacillus simplex]|uniref:hypothetical protein n=1 Tax=Peribacillus simplex TaxID=1478 RepID=UPI00366AB626
MEENDKFRKFISDDFMLWLDGVAFDQRGSLIFLAVTGYIKCLHIIKKVMTGTTSIGKAFVGEDVKPYLHSR